MSARNGDVVVGIDVGTTSMKAVVFTLDGREVATANAPTKWDVAADGTVETPIERLSEAAIGVMAKAAQSARGNVVGVGITGLAETGVVVDERGRPVTPAIAWYDQRGKDELAALPAEFRAEFSAVTGLAAKAECSFSKLLWWSRQGRTFTDGSQWLNALEYIAYSLTGVRASEPSLASRTGLLDQETVAPWAGTLDLLGLNGSFLPELVSAGTPFGAVTDQAPSALRGAAVTVGGHDHLVAAVGAGAASPESLFDSCGTADVIVRSVPRTLTNDERAHLVANGLSTGRHVVPGTTAILGATRSGLVLGRVMSMLGARNLEERRRLSGSWHPGAEVSPNVIVSEPPGWTNEVTVQVREYVSPQDVWGAAMAYVLDGTAAVLAPITEVAGEFRSAHAAGGWAQLPGVFAGKASIMPGLRLSEADLPGARGAAMFAAAAAGASDSALTNGLPTHPTAQQKEYVT